MAAHAVIFFHDPPTILYIFLPVGRVVEERRGHVRAVCADAAQKKRRQRRLPFIRQIRLRHAQVIARILLLVAIIDGRVAELVLEEAFVVVPLFDLLAVLVLVRAGVRVFAVFGVARLQREVEPLKRRRALVRQLFTDALLFLEAFVLVTARATEVGRRS